MPGQNILGNCAGLREIGISLSTMTVELVATSSCFSTPPNYTATFSGTMNVILDYVSPYDFDGTGFSLFSENCCCDLELEIQSAFSNVGAWTEVVTFTDGETENFSGTFSIAGASLFEEGITLNTRYSAGMCQTQIVLGAFSVNGEDLCLQPSIDNGNPISISSDWFDSGTIKTAHVLTYSATVTHLGVTTTMNYVFTITFA